MTAKTQLTPPPSDGELFPKPQEKIQTFDEALKNAAALENKPPPKKRGRPPKVVPVAGANSNGSAIPPTSSPNAVPAPSAGFDIPKEALAPLLQFPYSIAARKTGYDGFNLSKEETDALVPMLDAVLKQYLPAVSGPHATLMMFMGSVAMITGIRYSMYLDYRKSLAPRQNAKYDNGLNEMAARVQRESEIMPGVHV